MLNTDTGYNALRPVGVQPKPDAQRSQVRHRASKRDLFNNIADHSRNQLKSHSLIRLWLFAIADGWLMSIVTHRTDQILISGHGLTGKGEGSVGGAVHIGFQGEICAVDPDEIDTCIQAGKITAARPLGTGEAFGFVPIPFTANLDP